MIEPSQLLSPGIKIKSSLLPQLVVQKTFCQRFDRLFANVRYRVCTTYIFVRARTQSQKRTLQR